MFWIECDPCQVMYDAQTHPGVACELLAGQGVVVESDQPVVGVGRPHIGAKVTTYNGFTGGSLDMYMPMLFKNALGCTYNAAFYVQNTETSAASGSDGQVL